jgi:hypothetical protein
MSTASLRTAIVPRSSGNYQSCWVRLEQITPAEAKTKAAVVDIYNLWLAAATGKSAVRLRPDNCPVEFDGSITRVFLGFYIWPSRPALPYTLTVALGRLGTTSVVRPRRSFSAIIDNASRYALPYFMESVTVIWETPAWSPFGEQFLPPPAPRLVDGIWLVWDEEVFGAFRVDGIAVGASLVLEMEFTREVISRPLRPDEEQQWYTGPGGQLILTTRPDSKLDSHRITDLKNAITVRAACGGDDLGRDDIDHTTITTEIHDVTIPECVKTALSLCPGDEDLEELVCQSIPEKRVFYNACTGDILGEEEEDGGESYCSKTVTAPTSGQSWLPGGGL